VSDKPLAIVGGGIAGLTAAYYAVKSGKKNVHIFESSDRLGGNIRSVKMGGQYIEVGGGAFDKSHDTMRQLITDFKLDTVPNTDQDRETFQHPDTGLRVTGEEFHRMFKSLHEQIIRDKETTGKEPHGALAKRMNNLSMHDYLTQIAMQQATSERSYMQAAMDFVMGKNPISKETQATIKMACAAYQSEACGNNLNALQYSYEASAELGKLYASDCADSLKEGNESIIKAMEKYLVENGAQIHYNSTLASMDKKDDGATLTFGSGDTAQTFDTDKMVLALPAPALDGIKGIEQFGMSSQAHKMLSKSQYTNNAKFTVRVLPGQELEAANFFSNNGFQAWTATPGYLTFLCSGDAVQGGTYGEIAQNCMERYAQAYGKKADQMFDWSQGNIVFYRADRGKLCYSAPNIGEALQLASLEPELQKLAANGVCLAGGYIPKQTEDGREFGFMECAAKSGKDAIGRLFGLEQAIEQAQDLGAKQTLPQRASMVEQLTMRGNSGAGRYL
jgi:uncharacterized protein with NAD-binding domain and iron-sulfur cluster